MFWLTSLRKLVTRAPAAWFFGLALPAQGLLVAAEVQGVLPEWLIRLRLYLPAVIAVGLTALISGTAGLTKTFLSLVKLNLPWYWFFVALLYAPVVGIVPLLLFRAVGFIDHIEYDTNIVQSSGILFLKFVLTISLVEEISWVSFGITHLKQWFTPFVAAVIGGAAWGIWYIPLNVAGIQVAGRFPNLPMVINFMAIGASCAWVYYHTRSAILVALMQVVMNYTALVFPVLPKPGAEGIYYAFIAAKCTFAVTFFAWKGPKPLFSTVPIANSAEVR